MYAIRTAYNHGIFLYYFGTKTRSWSDEIVQIILEKISSVSLSHLFAS